MTQKPHFKWEDRKKYKLLPNGKYVEIYPNDETDTEKKDNEEK